MENKTMLGDTNNKSIELSNKIFDLSAEVEKAKALLENILLYFEDFRKIKEKNFVSKPNILSYVLLDYLTRLETGLEELEEYTLKSL